MVEVVVVGAGMAGVSTALALWSRGAAVNLVDGGRPASAATGASGGMLAPQYESPGPGPLYRAGVRGRSLWPAFARRLSELSAEEVTVDASGMLVANFSAREEAEARASIAWQREAGQRAEIVTATEALALQEGLGSGADSWLWLPDEGRVDAQRLVDVFDAAIRATSIRFLSGAAVREVVVTDRVASGVALEDGRRLSADRVVLAAGAWTPALAPLPVRPVRGQMLRFPAGPPRLHRLVASHAGRYIVPRPDGTVLVGSTMEEAGLDRSITDAGAHAIRATGRPLVPALFDRKPAEQWADLRPMTPDGLPVLGPDPRIEGLFHATGYGRNGILLGPLLAEVLADAVLGRAGEDSGLSDDDLAAFSPGRFR